MSDHVGFIYDPEKQAFVFITLAIYGLLCYLYLFHTVKGQKARLLGLNSCISQTMMFYPDTSRLSTMTLSKPKNFCPQECKPMVSKLSRMWVRRFVWGQSTGWIPHVGLVSGPDPVQDWLDWACSPSPAHSGLGPSALAPCVPDQAHCPGLTPVPYVLHWACCPSPALHMLGWACHPSPGLMYNGSGLSSSPTFQPDLAHGVISSGCGVRKCGGGEAVATLIASTSSTNFWTCGESCKPDDMVWPAGQIWPADHGLSTSGINYCARDQEQRCQQCWKPLAAVARNWLDEILPCDPGGWATCFIAEKDKSPKMLVSLTQGKNFFISLDLVTA